MDVLRTVDGYADQKVVLSEKVGVVVVYQSSVCLQCVVDDFAVSILLL